MLCQIFLFWIYFIFQIILSFLDMEMVLVFVIFPDGREQSTHHMMDAIGIDVLVRDWLSYSRIFQFYYQRPKGWIASIILLIARPKIWVLSICDQYSKTLDIFLIALLPSVNFGLDQYDSMYHLGPLLLTWFNFNPSMNK